MMKGVHNIQKLQEEYGYTTMFRTFKELASIIMETLRDTDIIAIDLEQNILFLLPETPLKNTQIIIERLQKRVKELSPPLVLNISVVSYPQSGKTAVELHEMLNIGIAKSREQGGSVVIIKE